MARPVKLNSQAVAEAVRLRAEGAAWKEIARALPVQCSRTTLWAAWRRGVSEHIRACEPAEECAT